MEEIEEALVVFRAVSWTGRAVADVWASACGSRKVSESATASKRSGQLGIGGPPGYRFMHNLPNKPLIGYRICRILKTKEIIFKIFKTLELWLPWNSGRHKPEAGGFCLDLS